MSAEFWDARYRSSTSVWSGDPNPQLVTEVADLPAGAALDVGSGEGADAIWLAERGWRVTAVDISVVALERSAQLASLNGDIASNIDWVQADITSWHPPAAAFDLVSVHFMQMPPDVRDPVFRKLAAGVAPGGTLLVVGHHPSDLETTARRPRGANVLYDAEAIAALLAPEAWEIALSEARPRDVKDGEGRAITVHDAILRARRVH